MARRWSFVVPGLALLIVPPAAPQLFHRPVPVPPSTFPVMAWGGAPSEPEQLRDMKAAGLNVAGFCRIEDLEKVRQAGLTCFVTDRRVNGYDWVKMPNDDELRRNVSEAVRAVGDNPAAFGYYLRDEPHASLMAGLGRVSALVRELAPGKLPYVNLFPYRVSKDRLGTPDYGSYVRKLVDVIRQPFLSYDNYSLVGGEMLEYFYNNLEIVRRLALETGTPFWNCILANAHFNYMEPSDATLHLQVYATLAYGGKGIQYFTYYTPHNGNYRLGAVDQFGNKTATYDALRRINLEIHALAPVIGQLRSTGVFHSPDVPEMGQPLSQSKLVAGVTMVQRLVRNPVAGRFLMGEFEDGQGRPYLMLVNKDLQHCFQFQLQLRNPSRKLIRICNYSGQEEEFGREMDWLAPGAGVLLRLE